MFFRLYPILAAVALLAPTPALQDQRHDGDPVALTILTLNLAMREDTDAIESELAARGLARRADIVLLQEVVQRDGDADVGSKLARALDLQSVFRPAFALDAHRMMGLAILSRHRMTDPHVLQLKRFDLSFRSRHRIALGAAIDSPAGPIRVYNVHLDTRINVGERIEQLTDVTRELDGTDGPTIIGGDFNTNDNRWLFHAMPLPFVGHQRDGVLRFMQGLGFRSAITGRVPTHDALGMQLDWIFLKGLSASSAAIQPMDISDHHALIASVTVSNRSQSGSGR
jgi:endonuclease/exonuclease/phosphatase (EEP) superfamily protein YafD